MKKNGFTLIELLAVIAVLAIVLLIAVPNILNVIIDVKANTYVKNAIMLNKASENYLAANPLSMPGNIGDTIILKLSDLKAANYITAVKDPDNSSNECSGYVMVTRVSSSKLEYTPYLNCNNNFSSPIEDSLVLNYKFENFEEPTYNATPNGAFAGGLKVTSESGSYGNNVIIPFKSPIETGYVLKQGPGIGTYVVHFKSATPIKASTTYTMRCWVSYTADYDGDHGVFHHRVWDSTGTPTSNGLEPGTLVETVVIDDITWQRRMFSITTPATVNGSFDWYIGYSTNNTVGARYITGIQLEEKAYPTPWVVNARTATVKDYSGNNVTANIPLATSPKWIDGYYDFDGINDYFQIPDFSLASNIFTMNIFVNPSLTGSGSGMFITPSSNGLDQRIAYDYANSRIVMNLASSSDTNERSIATPNNSVEKNKWSMITVTINNQNVKIYVNGQLKLESNEALGIGTWNGIWHFGQRGNDTNYYKGYLDDLSIYKRVLSSDEINDLYNLRKK